VRYLDEKPAMLERSLFPYEIGKHLLGTDFHHGSVYQALAHVGILPTRARHTIDAIAAHPLEVEQLHIAPGSPLLRVRRLAYNEFGIVIESADDRYLPTMATFVIENSAKHRNPLSRQAASPATGLLASYDPGLG
jgi:GntR family transcriptional regulator